MTLPDIAPPLLRWYEQNKRTLPFRTVSTPYRVWVSEIMLQQTRVSAALPYFERFMAELPTVADLAACDPERLHKLWEGLGYYSRVRNLQKAAQIVMEQHGGALPADYDALLKLPGVGAYTAGAIASISFGLPVPAVDGNVLRVFARILNDGRDVTRPDVKKDLTACVMKLQPPERPGDYNQALMELGGIGVPAGRRAPVQRMSLARAVCGPRPGRAGDTARKGAARCKKERSIGPWRWCWIWKTGASCCSSARRRGFWRGCGSPCCWRARAAPYKQSRHWRRSASQPAPWSL